MIVRWLSVVLIAFASVAFAAEPPPPSRLPPIDEASKDPSFVKFRNELKDVIARKDAAKLFHYLASDIRVTFGGGDGDDYGGPEFHKMWKPFDKDTKVWKALALVVDNGGKFAVPNGFAAPWAYAAFPEDLDGFTYAVVTNPQAVLRDAPNANAKVIRKLDYDLVEVLKSTGKTQHEATPADWDEVKTTSGQRGFVQTADIRSPIDYRAIFEKRKGKWVIQTFIAGD